MFLNNAITPQEGVYRHIRVWVDCEQSLFLSDSEAEIEREPRLFSRARPKNSRSPAVPKRRALGLRLRLLRRLGFGPLDGVTVVNNAINHSLVVNIR